MCISIGKYITRIDWNSAKQNFKMNFYFFFQKSGQEVGNDTYGKCMRVVFDKVAER